MIEASSAGADIQVRKVGLRYGKTVALEDVSLDIPGDCMVGLIGPDGVGKSSLLALIVGARRLQSGTIHVLGGDISDPQHRDASCPRIAYMPQGLGKNLYHTLSVFENVDFFGRLFGQDKAEREARIADLLESTGLTPFRDRPAGKLSGGMKQKLGLCCALIHDPDLLVLDEPTTGVDPLSRAQFWDLIARIRARRSGMSVLVATAYMEEAERFDWLVAMDAGKVLATGSAQELREKTGAADLDAAFIALLPQAQREGHQAVQIPPRTGEDEIAIEARDLTMRFGDFVAVDHVNFRIERGEIFGFLGSNGCGKSTTMKMLTGLLPASEGEALLFGQKVDPRNIDTRRRVGYMSQAFSLYSELSVRQNLELHARLFHLPPADIPTRLTELAERFMLGEVMDALPEALPLGIRQRLSLAVAVLHRPDMLILDEPTSGVDPIARDIFWQLMADLSRQDKVTIFISTHFMNEAERCDRISLMHAGKVLASDRPQALVEKRGLGTLEATFIAYLEDAISGVDRLADPAAKTSGEARTQRDGLSVPPLYAAPRDSVTSDSMNGDSMDGGSVTGGSITGGPAARQALELPVPAHAPALATPPLDQGTAGTAPQPVAATAIDFGTNGAVQPPAPAHRRAFSARRMLSYSMRESLELRRDPIRLTMALLGTVILMFIMGYGITMDVENLKFAVLDRDQTGTSQGYVLNLSGSRYFIERAPIADYTELDTRMRAGDLSFAIEIPPNFGRDVARGAPARIGVWIDGAATSRAETIQGYVQGIHAAWMSQTLGPAAASPISIETRYRYNPDVRSLPAIVPAVIPILLMMIPAMLGALSVVREKELGSIINLYVTPVTKLEFLLGKQLPYVALTMFNFFSLSALAVFVFKVPYAGSFLTATLAALLYGVIATGFGLLVSTFTSSQIAAIFGTTIATIIPASQFSGMIDPVSSLEGMAHWIGTVYPTTYFLTIMRGTVSKALGLGDLYHAFIPLVIAIPVILGASVMRLKKQDG